MKQLLILLLVSTALAFGQASTTELLPSNFAAAGAMYTPSATSRYTGWATYAHLLDQKTGSYLFTTEDVIPVLTKPFAVQTSARVGFGTLLKQFGQTRLWAIVDGGGATTGTTSGGAAGGRSCLTTPWRKTVYSFIGCYGILKSNIVPGTPKVIEFGVGKSW